MTNYKARLDACEYDSAVELLEFAAHCAIFHDLTAGEFIAWQRAKFLDSPTEPDGSVLFGMRELEKHLSTPTLFASWALYMASAHRNKVSPSVMLEKWAREQLNKAEA